MALREKELGPDEELLFHLRTHWKALAGPVLVLLCLAAGTGAAMALLPAAIQPWANYAVGLLALVAFVAWVLAPFLRWQTTTFSLTTRRIITREGVLVRRGHDLPLRRITDVTYERSVSDRLFGCGTLVVTSAAEEPLTLSDVPGVEAVHREMNALLFAEDPEPLPRY